MHKLQARRDDRKKRVTFILRRRDCEAGLSYAGYDSSDFFWILTFWSDVTRIDEWWFYAATKSNRTEFVLDSAFCANLHTFTEYYLVNRSLYVALYWNISINISNRILIYIHHVVQLWWLLNAEKPALHFPGIDTRIYFKMYDITKKLVIKMFVLYGSYK